MTIQLFKSKEEAHEHIKNMKQFNPWYSGYIVKIKYHKDDRGMFGMRGFGFEAKHGKIYYILEDIAGDAKTWGLKSKVYG